MPNSAIENGEQSIDRRRVLKTLGATVGLGSIAGCSNNDDDTGGNGQGSQDLGERVPAMDGYWVTSTSLAPVWESILPVLVEDFEKLGVTLEPNGREIGYITNNLEGKYYTDLEIYVLNPFPSRIDPTQLMSFAHSKNAGAAGQLSAGYYANCEYDAAFEKMTSATTTEERLRGFNEALSIQSNDNMLLPVAPTLVYGAARDDSVKLGTVGEMGITRLNQTLFTTLDSKGKESVTINANPALVQSKNFPTLKEGIPLRVWNNLVYSPPMEINENLQINGVLAEDWEFENEAKTLRLTLREDATFTNGDPVTAEDVKFSYEYYQKTVEVGVNAQFTSMPLSEKGIEVIDDQTAVFHFTQPYLSAANLNLARWGVLHKESWEGAKENPQGFEPDEIVGSGPFEVESFEKGSFLSLTPRTDHPTHQPKTDLVFQPFQNFQTAYQAFKNGEIDIISDVTPGIFRRIQDEMADEVTFKIFNGFVGYNIFPFFPKAPTKFGEFREAMGMVFNRKKINDLAFLGEAEMPLSSGVFLENHPWVESDTLHRPTDKLQGDPEGARSILEEAGWGWDDNGNLHYPPDADLSPLWPSGESPPPEDFPCVEGSS